MITNLAEKKNYLGYLISRPTNLIVCLPKVALYLAGVIHRRIWATIKKTKIIRQVIRFRTGSKLAREISAGRLKLVLDKIPAIKFIFLSEDKFAEIRLASTAIPVTADLDWNYPFPDREDSFALHRFGWLLAVLVQRPSVNLANDALNWLSSWMQENGKPGFGFAWESYSVAERLSNWPFILAIINSLVTIPADFLENIEENMVTQVDYLINNLEVRGRLTNNHVINDARGLYIAGVLLGSEIARQKAKEIFLKWTKEIFSNDGMLRENSSHYQYLLYQRYEQVYFLSHYARDEQFCEFIKNWLPAMADSCKFFAVYGADGSWDLPLIGDISPDFTPGWLAPNSTGEWQRLKKMLGWRGLAEGQCSELKSLEIKGDKFIRYSRGEVVVFWHIPGGDQTLLRHGHYDLGSFVLFYTGQEVIADPGRYSYLQAGSFGVGAMAHSSLLIDSLGAQCEDYQLNSFQAYGRREVKYHLSESQQELNLEIETDGFTRLRTPVEWTRRFTVTKNRLTIIDILESAGVNQVEARFQVNPGFKLQELGGGFKLSSGALPPLELKVKDSSPYRYELSTGNADGEAGWVSKEYGRRAPGTTLLFQRELRQRQIHIYEIAWQ